MWACPIGQCCHSCALSSAPIGCERFGLYLRDGGEAWPHSKGACLTLSPPPALHAGAGQLHQGPFGGSWGPFQHRHPRQLAWRLPQPPGYGPPPRTLPHIPHPLNRPPFSPPSPSCPLLCPTDNAIPIKSWFSDPSDTALLNLLPMLDALRWAGWGELRGGRKWGWGARMRMGGVLEGSWMPGLVGGGVTAEFWDPCGSDSAPHRPLFPPQVHGRRPLGAEPKSPPAPPLVTAAPARPRPLQRGHAPS